MAKRFIDKDSVAIFYEKITGQCQFDGTLSIVDDGKPPFDMTVDIDDELRRHPWLDVIIVPRSELPGLHTVFPENGPSVSANEHFFRQTIANHTGAPYFERGADRAVLVHPESGEVVSIHLGNVPGRDHPPIPDHHLISHRSADVGDIWDGGRFMRRYAVVHLVTGEAVSIIEAPVDEPEDILPPSPLPDHHVVIARHLIKVGDKLSIKSG